MARKGRIPNGLAVGEISHNPGHAGLFKLPLMPSCGSITTTVTRKFAADNSGVPSRIFWVEKQDILAKRESELISGSAVTKFSGQSDLTRTPFGIHCNIRFMSRSGYIERYEVQSDKIKMIRPHAKVKWSFQAHSSPLYYSSTFLYWRIWSTLKLERTRDKMIAGGSDQVR